MHGDKNLRINFQRLARDPPINIPTVASSTDVSTKGVRPDKKAWNARTQRALLNSKTQHFDLALVVWSLCHLQTYC